MVTKTKKPKRSLKDSEPPQIGLKPSTLGFIFMAIGLSLTFFTVVGFQVLKDKSLSIIFTIQYIACILCFFQYVIRYIVVAGVYKIENSLGAWLVSISILFVGLFSIQATLLGQPWLLFYGLLFLLAAIKVQQAKDAIRNRPDYSTNEQLKEVVKREEDVQIIELLGGILLAFFYSTSSMDFGMSKIALSTPEAMRSASLFFGSVIALFLTAYLTITTYKHHKNELFAFLIRS